jgi:hypothetical protein
VEKIVGRRLQITEAVSTHEAAVGGEGDVVSEDTGTHARTCHCGLDSLFGELNAPQCQESRASAELHPFALAEIRPSTWRGSLYYSMAIGEWHGSCFNVGHRTCRSSSFEGLEISRVVGTKEESSGTAYRPARIEAITPVPAVA